MSSTPNFTLPLLHAAQAQKEIAHNEALVLIDSLLAAIIQGIANDPAALAPQSGQAWIIGNSPVGPWSGKPHAIAVFTDGGWRFASPLAGMRMFDRTAGLVRRYDGTSWLSGAAIAEPSGGTVVDVEARAVLSAVLAVLRQSGLAAVT